MEGRREKEGEKRLVVSVFERFPVIVPLPTLFIHKISVCLLWVQSAQLDCNFNSAVFSHSETAVQYILAVEEDESGKGWKGVGVFLCEPASSTWAAMHWTGAMKTCQRCFVHSGLCSC